MARPTCRELFSSAVAWCATSTIITGFFLCLGTILLVEECFVPDTDKPSAQCASETTTLLSNRFVMFLLIALITFILVFLSQILVAIGWTCDSMCNNERHTVFVTLLSAVSSSLYVNYLTRELNDIPKSFVGNPDACLI